MESLSGWQRLGIVLSVIDHLVAIPKKQLRLNFKTLVEAE
jgi:hypothetical protein